LSAVHTLILSTHHTCQFTWTTHLIKHENSMDVCTNATTLNVDTKLTYALLLDIAQFCKHLEFLNIDDATESTDSVSTSSGLNAVINNCASLKGIGVGTESDRTRYAGMMASHSHLFVVGRVPAYDVMKM